MASPAPSNPLISRRPFLGRIALALTALVAAIIGLPTFAFIFRGTFRRLPQQWRNLGPLAAFPTGQTILVSFETAHTDEWARESAREGAWVRRSANDEFIAFSMHCTHLGCPVRWQATAGLFLCPCHGGVYHDDGSVAAGPPLYPLQRHRIRVQDGQVEIETNAIPIT